MAVPVRVLTPLTARAPLTEVVGPLKFAVPDTVSAPRMLLSAVLV